MRIWADERGDSHLEEVTLDRTVTPAEPGVAELWVSEGFPVEEVTLDRTVTPAEPGVAELWISEGFPVDRLHLVMVKAQVPAPDWHCGPRRQFVVFLDGWVRLTTSGDGTFQFPAGTVVLIEDLHGRGHMTEHEPGDCHVLVIPIDPEGLISRR